MCQPQKQSVFSASDFQREYLDIQSKINGNENFTVAGVSGLYAAVLFQNVGSLAQILVLVGPLIAFLGWFRAREMHAHLSDIITHMKSIEEKNSSDEKDGWFSRYEGSLQHDPVTQILSIIFFQYDHYIMSARIWFWVLLLIGSVVGAGLIATENERLAAN